MTEIRPSTPEEFLHSGNMTVRPVLVPRTQSSAYQMQGFAGSAVQSVPFAADCDGHMSLHSEPDMDTIMPLPGTARSAHAQLQNVVGPPRSNLVEEESDSDGELEDSTRTPLSPNSSGFATIEHPMIGQDIFGDDLTAKALETCKKTVLHPYFIFLKVIGWRRLRTAHYDLEPPLWQSVMNVVWPTFVCLLILASCATQIVTCFRRDTVHHSHICVANVTNGTNEIYYDVECERHILTTFIIPDILLISAFVYGLYIFRWVQTEQLSTLTEAVFLGHMTRHGRYSYKRLTITLQLLIFLGLLWILFSLGASIFRVFTLHLLSEHTRIEWIPSYQIGKMSSNLVVRWILVIFTMVGFIILDMAYIAVVINYSIQCQLLIYLMQNICDRMRTKEWEIEQAIKEMKKAREFLSKLNNHLARAVSILFFIFITNSVNAFYGLKQLKPSAELPSIAAGGILAAIQWATILILPLVQAARVTRACTRMKKVPLEIRSRPYNYTDTPQLDLDSIVTFSAALNMSAKLISIPVHPALVAGLFFVAGLTLFIVFQYDTFKWAKWL